MIICSNLLLRTSASYYRNRHFQIFFSLLFFRTRFSRISDRRDRWMRSNRLAPHPHHHLRRQSRQVLLLQLGQLALAPQQERL
jgi:hypothetical protein